MKLFLPALVLLLALPPASAASESAAPTETCYGYDATYVGTPGDDEVTVDEKNNVVAILGGNNFVRVAPDARRKAGVFICLGDGNDDMVGGPVDKLDGGPGYDRANFTSAARTSSTTSRASSPTATRMSAHDATTPLPPRSGQRPPHHVSGSGLSAAAGVARHSSEHAAWACCAIHRTATKASSSPTPTRDKTVRNGSRRWGGS